MSFLFSQKPKIPPMGDKMTGSSATIKIATRKNVIREVEGDTEEAGTEIKGVAKEAIVRIATTNPGHKISIETRKNDLRDIQNSVSKVAKGLVTRHTVTTTLHKIISRVVKRASVLP